MNPFFSSLGFPRVVEEVNRRGAYLVMPPFKTGGKQFSSQENSECYAIASVRIHVERAINRLKYFKVLKALENSLFPYVDKILLCLAHICNHMPLLIKDQIEEEID